MPKSWASASIPCSRKKPGRPLWVAYVIHCLPTSGLTVYGSRSASLTKMQAPQTAPYSSSTEGVIRHSELHQGTLPDVPAILAKLAELQG